MQKIHGNTQGLKANQKKRLANLYRRRVPLSELILAEQATALCRLSHEIGRQIGLVISRKGEVVQVLVGQAERMPSPDPSRFRRSRSRLSGYSFIHTVFSDGFNPEDQSGLFMRRWDILAALEVREDGLVGRAHVMHLLPQEVDGMDHRILPPFRLGLNQEDFASLIIALEDEFHRLTPPEEIGSQGRAILISVTTGPRYAAEERMVELEELARSAGLSIVGREIQQRKKLDPRSLMGRGRLEQVLLQTLRLDADVLVFDQDMSPSQAHYLASHTSSDLKVLDRTQLILDIFAQRARTKEGKLQVEMAQLRYLTPRLANLDDGLSRLTGGIGGRGPGETKLEVDRRRVRDRLHKLKTNLKKIAKQRERQRIHRNKQGLPILSIVGYTNAGKSTLLNALTGSKVMVQNRLFATLDPTTRRLRFPREREVIITDTVGFIRDLPPELKQAFSATLEELHAADLLIHVVDAGNPQVEEQLAAVNNILADLSLNRIPILVVLNKVDTIDAERAEALARRYQAVCISALKPDTLKPLLNKMESMVEGVADEWSQPQED